MHSSTIHKNFITLARSAHAGVAKDDRAPTVVAAVHQRNSDKDGPLTISQRRGVGTICDCHLVNLPVNEVCGHAWLQTEPHAIRAS